MTLGSALVISAGALLILRCARPKILEGDQPERFIVNSSEPSISHPGPGSDIEWLEGYFPNFVFKTHEGKEVRFFDDLLKGNKIVLINFIYTTCTGSCPGTTANLVKVQEALGDRMGRDIFMYSITLDPATDTPEVLKVFRESYHVKPGWYFLTGKLEEIEKLRRKLGVYDPDPKVDSDKTQHAGLVVYGNQAFSRWKTIPGLFKPETIVDAVLGLGQKFR